MPRFWNNTTVHSATVINPFKVVFDSEAFEFEAEISIRLAKDNHTVTDLATALRETHDMLRSNVSVAKDRAERYYNKAVSEVQFSVGDRVVIYESEGDLSEERKLRSPWLGPYVFREVLSPLGNLLQKEVSGPVSRSNVNRLAHMSAKITEPEDPREGVFPDTQGILQKIGGKISLGTETEYKVLSERRRGFSWKKREDFPLCVTRAK